MSSESADNLKGEETVNLTTCTQNSQTFIISNCPKTTAL